MRVLGASRYVFYYPIRPIRRVSGTSLDHSAVMVLSGAGRHGPVSSGSISPAAFCRALFFFLPFCHHVGSVEGPGTGTRNAMTGRLCGLAVLQKGNPASGNPGSCHGTFISFAAVGRGGCECRLLRGRTLAEEPAGIAGLIAALSPASCSRTGFSRVRVCPGAGIASVRVPALEPSR